MNPCRLVAKRNQMHLDADDLILMRLAHIVHEDVFAGIETALELLRLNLSNLCARGCFGLLALNAAELVLSISSLTVGSAPHIPALELVESRSTLLVASLPERKASLTIFD